MFKKRFPLHGGIAGISLLFLMAAQLSGQGDALESAVRNLAHRTMPMMQGHGATCLDWQNRAAISDLRSLQLRSAFLSELTNLQNSEKQPGAPCEVRVVIDLTPTHYVFAAEITGEAKRMLINQVPRSDVAPSAGSGAALRLQKELLWQQSGRILDAIQIGGAEGQPLGLLVLTPDGVFLYQRESGQSKLQRPWSLGGIPGDRRAPRGELAVSADSPSSLRILLPGRLCELNLRDAAGPLCRSGAESRRSQALLHSQCDSVTWGLRADSGDWSTTDRIVLFDSSAPTARAPLSEVDVPGPVLSLSGGVSGATAVIFNLATGNYEVYAIALDCAN